MSVEGPSWKERFFYYFWPTYRRKLLDKVQQEHSHLYQGVVLDIGGRDRGLFRRPKAQAARWIDADIDPKYKPDMVLDVTDMPAVASGSIDVINAIELFEHVREAERGIAECCRVLKPGGVLIIAVPFLYPYHADPYDYQRWTETKWRDVLSGAGFDVEEFAVMGRFFTVHGDMARLFAAGMPGLVKKLCYLFYPLLDALVLLDNTSFVLKNKMLSSYHEGYFMVCRKRRA